METIDGDTCPSELLGQFIGEENIQEFGQVVHGSPIVRSLALEIIPRNGSDPIMGVGSDVDDS